MDDRAARRLAHDPLPAGFVRRTTVVAPGTTLRYDEAEWVDAIVVVDRGELLVEGRCGRRWRFGPGAVLRLCGLPLATLRNDGDEPTVLVAVSRRRPGP